MHAASNYVNLLHGTGRGVLSSNTVLYCANGVIFTRPDSMHNLSCFRFHPNYFHCLHVVGFVQHNVSYRFILYLVLPYIIKVRLSDFI